MKTLITTVAAAVLAASFAMTADAATAKKQTTAMSAKQTACHEQAKKKFSAVHFLKRKAYEKKCMGNA
jgi:Ni/Co efflux regulator RcnB